MSVPMQFSKQGTPGKSRSREGNDVVILIALGANLPHPVHGPPRSTCEAALATLEAAGVIVAGRSPWYESAPVPASDQPWFVNGVARVETGLEPAGLLALLHEIERRFGRVRGERNRARILDLDLLAYGDRVTAPDAVPALPHPRLAERAFVVLPLADLAPDWRHPISGLSAAELAGRLPKGQVVKRLCS